MKLFFCYIFQILMVSYVMSHINGIELTCKPFSLQWSHYFTCPLYWLAEIILVANVLVW